jgi:hypothetical protein
MSNTSRILILVTLCLIIAFALSYLARTNELHGQRETQPSLASTPNTSDLPDSVPADVHSYRDALNRLEAQRVVLASRYQKATSTAQKDEVIAQARAVVTQTIYTEIFPSWYGTSWDFNGTAEAPRQGKIACGYFVTTLLRDARWKVQRARLAQQASENIILTLTEDDNVKRFRHTEIGDFVKAVKDWGSGLYVVGLDIHVGFIVNTGGEVYFIHSSYFEPYAVVKERASASKILATSKYRVLGKITADDAFMEKWLLSKEIVTRVSSHQR